jgi:hypothetical protein
MYILQLSSDEPCPPSRRIASAGPRIRSKSSILWTLFPPAPDKDGHVVCRLNELSKSSGVHDILISSSHTGNLWRHLETWHKKAYDLCMQIRDSKQSMSSEAGAEMVLKNDLPFKKKV